MFEHVNQSKFRVPKKQKGFLHRARLIDWMHENIHRKLTFVSAPAGYGKTSLLLDFAGDVDARICWLLITPGDQDLRRFAWDLLLAIRQSFPGFGEEIEVVLQTNQGGLDAVNLAIDFVNEALRSIDDYCLLFIDDFHIVSESDGVTGFLELFLDYLPDGVRVILASRTEFGIPSGKLYARNEINLLNVDQLRFRSDELQQLVARAYRLKLSDLEAAELAKRSDGWIVAVMLAAKSLKSGSIPEFQGSTEHVYSFLAQDVIERETPRLQKFMLAVSVVDEFSIDIADCLTDNGSAAALIRELERRNLFITQIEMSAGTSYRFHQLFLEFLRHRLAVSHRSWKRELHRQAARWYEENRDWEPAIHQYLEVGDRQSAARLMDFVAKQFFAVGENLRVQKWLEILSKPPDMRAAAPELVLNHAKYLLDQNHLSEAERLLKIAEEVFDSAGETDKILNGLSVRGLIFLRKKQFEDALHVVGRAQSILAGEIRGELYVARAQQFARIEGLYYLWQGEREEGVERLKRVTADLQEIIEKVSSRSDKIQAAHDLVLSLDSLAIGLYQAGRIYEGQTYFLQALTYREKYLRNNQGLVYSLNNIGYIYFQIGDYLKSYTYLKRAFRAAETVVKGQAVIHLFNSWGDLLRELDEWEAAEMSITAALKIGEDAAQKKKELDNSGSYMAFMALERARGNFDKAIYYLHEAYRLQQRAPDTPEFFAHLGAIYFSMGQIDLSIETLSQAVGRQNEDMPAVEPLAIADFLLGCAYFRKGRNAEALRSLKRALAAAAVMGYDQFLISEGRKEKPYFEFAVQQMPDSAQLRSILKRVNAFQTGLLQFEEAGEPERDEPRKIQLEVFGFGAGKIRLNGEIVRKSDWRANMAKALFFYILDRGGDSGANIKLAFWPEKPGSKATSNFQSTLWRARNALNGLNVLVLENDQYRLSEDVSLWFDVEEFESLLEKAKDSSLSETGRVDLWQSAVELYTGDYLEDVFMDWSDQRRIRLQIMFQDALDHLGSHAFARGKLDQAMKFFEQLIQIDPYRDDIQIKVMNGLIESEAPVSANRRYQSYVRFLEAEGLEPSEKLKEFYRVLQNHL